jgi:hypothetical protein
MRGKRSVQSEAAAREKAHPAVPLAGDEAVAVVFDLVDPLRADRRLRCAGRDARLDYAWSLRWPASCAPLHARKMARHGLLGKGSGAPLLSRASAHLSKWPPAAIRGSETMCLPSAENPTFDGPGQCRPRRLKAGLLHAESRPPMRDSGAVANLASTVSNLKRPPRASPIKKHAYPGFLAVTFQELESMMTPPGR